MQARLVLASTIAFLSAAPTAAEPPVLKRFPTSSRGSIVFVARGRAWIAPVAGGRARSLTDGEGEVSATRFSPDGRWVAYTRRIDGGQDVFVVAVDGSDVRRLTHDARAWVGDNLVVGWSPDSLRVLFLSTRSSVAAKQVRAFSAPVSGGPAEALPLEQAGRLDVSAADGRIAYTRTFTELAARKRYVGGMAEDVWIYDPARRSSRRMTDWKGTDGAPMWAGGRIYFVSDRGAGFKLNLWCLDPATGRTRQVTRFADFDVDWPSASADRLTFQQAGRLWALELPSERLREVRVAVPDDGSRVASRPVAVGREARASDVSGAADYSILPDGSEILLAAHGDLFRVSPDGTARNVTATPGTDEDHPAAAPRGGAIAYVTEDASSDQVALREASGGPRLLTRFRDAVLYAPIFSPDGRRLAVADAQHRLWLVDAAGGARLVARDPLAEIRDAAFSPDGRLLAYSTMRPSGLPALQLYDVVDGSRAELSGKMDGDRLPAFSADGSRLLFVSQRRELLAGDDRGDEAAFAAVASDGVFAMPLKDGRPAVSRTYALPVASGRIVGLAVRGGDLLYDLRPPAWIGGDLPLGGTELHRIRADGSDEVVLRGYESQVVSDDGRRAVFRLGGEWRTATLGGPSAPLATDRMVAVVDPRAEWREMLERAWRLDRDLFFNPTMNGTDWPTVRAAYEPLLPALGSRGDFLHLLGQMQGEMATSHAFVGGVDPAASLHRTGVARLGADLELDVGAGRYRFSRVYAGDPTRRRFRAPLNDPARGVSVEAGAYLLAVDGRELRSGDDPDALLAGGSRPLRLEVSDRPGGGRRTLIVTPVDDDLDLRQLDWIGRNRDAVDRLAGGRVGYVFLGDFAASGSEDLLRQLRGQIGREGLIVDLRWNRGGYTSQAVLDVLRRSRAGALINRQGAEAPLPPVSGPPVLTTIVNAQTASDGDQFAYFFRETGMGTLVGQRTWGGVQGIRGPWPLMDGTTITIPKDSLARDGRWIIENEGVAPDVRVDPEPDEAASGGDRMLARAVAETLRRLGERDPAVPGRPGWTPAYPPAGQVPGATFRSGARRQR